jgi:hypothetical protein
LPGGGCLFVMPALDGRIAIAKLITFAPATLACGGQPSRATWRCSDVATGEQADTRQTGGHGGFPTSSRNAPSRRLLHFPE